MAQTGYTPIQIYSTSTAAAVPTAGSLTNSTLGSELAINITDGKLFYKDNANAVQVIGWKTVPVSAGGTGLTSLTANGILYASSASSMATGSALTFDGTNFATTGTASATKFIPTGGTATGNGMYLPAANTLAWSANGTEWVRLNSDGRVGLGSAGSTATNLAIAKNITGSTTGIGTIVNASVQSDVTGAAYGYRSSPTTQATTFTLTDLYHFAALPQAFGASSIVTNQYGFAAFTNLTGATNNYGFYSNIASASGRWNFYANGTAANYFAGQAQFANGSVGTPSISNINDTNTGIFFPAADTIAFAEGGAEVMRLFSTSGVSIGDTTDPGAGNLRLGTGNLVIGTSDKGIDFSATPGTGTSELFNDYEEGTWTPFVSDDSGSASEGQTYSVQVGTYTKIGNTVFVQGRIVMSSLGTLSTAQNVRLNGFPFTSSSTTNNFAVVSFGQGQGLSITAGQSLTGYLNPAGIVSTIRVWSQTTGTSELLFSQLTASGGFIFSCSYKV